MGGSGNNFDWASLVEPGVVHWHWMTSKNVLVGGHLTSVTYIGSTFDTIAFLLVTSARQWSMYDI